MRILVNGLPYFSERLVNDLNNFDPENKYVFLNTYESLWAKIQFFILLPFFDKVISMNGVSDESGSLNWVVRLKKPLIMLWQGTDVSMAVTRFSNKTIYTKYINHARHYAVAPWLLQELNSIDIHARLLSFIWLEPHDDVPTKPQSFEVLTYLGKGKEHFYGWNYIRDAAKALPRVEFIIIGSEGNGLSDLPNIKFLGWVDKNEMKQLQQKSSVLVRMTEHDGNSHMVSEALAAGLDVIWNNPHPRVHQANNTLELINELEKLRIKFTETGGQKNSENVQWVRKHLAKDVVLANVVRKIKEA